MLTKSTVAPWEVVRDFIDSLKSTARGEETTQQRHEDQIPDESGKQVSQTELIEKRERRDKTFENKRYVVRPEPAIGKMLLDTSMSPIKRETQTEEGFNTVAKEEPRANRIKHEVVQHEGLNSRGILTNQPEEKELEGSSAPLFLRRDKKIPP